MSDGAVTQFSKIKNLLSDYDKGSPEGFLNTLRRLRNLPPDLMAALPDIEYSKLIELKPVKDEKRRENLCLQDLEGYLSWQKITVTTMLLLVIASSDGLWSQTPKLYRLQGFLPLIYPNLQISPIAGLT